MMQHRPRQRTKTIQSNSAVVARRARVKVLRTVTHARIGAVAGLTVIVPTVTAMIVIAALPNLMMTSRRIARMSVDLHVMQQTLMQALQARVAVVVVAAISKVLKHKATTVNDLLMMRHCAKKLSQTRLTLIRLKKPAVMPSVDVVIVDRAIRISAHVARILMVWTQHWTVQPQ
jgi:hypothetical protein